MGLLDDIIAVEDDILGVRDLIGAVRQPVYLVTRIWSGGGIGDGSFQDIVAQMLPSPATINLAVRRKASAGGNQEQGDIRLSMVSKNSYPQRSMIDCSVDAGVVNIEKFYRVGASALYVVTRVEEDYVTWTVDIKEVQNVG